ncbi:MAG: hypothetical protein ACI97A_002283 [Planctomycetota bacterium]|jgi:hypothetical protein
MFSRNILFAAFILGTLFSGLLRGQETVTAEKAAQDLAREIEKKVSEVRGLSYLSPTKVGVHTATALREFLTGELDKELTPEIASKHERCMVMLGLYDHQTDLRSAAMALLAEQVAGFYNPEKKELFLIKRSGEESANSKKMDRTIMAHELVHALQDQHFNLTKFLSDVSTNDDMTTARKSLVEGDATWAMLAFDQGAKMTSSMLKPPMSAMIPDDIAAMKPLFEKAKQLGIDMGSSDGLNTDALFNAPLVDADEMVFSYYGGAKFCNHLIAKGGMKALDAAFTRPPQSSEQILHPKKYDVEYDAPQSVTLPDLANILGSGFTKVGSNTLGEMRIRSWLSELGHKGKQKKQTHSGWDGDTYAVYGGANLADALLWVSVWDSPEDAKEFAVVANAFIMKLTPDAVVQDGLRCQYGLASTVVVDGSKVFVLRQIPMKKYNDILHRVQSATQFKEIRFAEDTKK